jgi:hypothetical protein
MMSGYGQKKRFLDESYNIKNLTSANSINIARWIYLNVLFLLCLQEIKTE